MQCNCHFIHVLWLRYKWLSPFFGCQIGVSFEGNNVQVITEAAQLSVGCILDLMLKLWIWGVLISIWGSMTTYLLYLYYIREWINTSRAAVIFGDVEGSWGYCLALLDGPWEPNTHSTCEFTQLRKLNKLSRNTVNYKSGLTYTSKKFSVLRN